MHIIKAYFNIERMTDVIIYYNKQWVYTSESYSNFVRLYGHEYDEQIKAVYEK